MLATKYLERYLTEKGTLISTTLKDFFDVYLNETVVKSYRKTSGYEDVRFDASRDVLSNFKNIQALTKDC